jgi:hypothetical protein
MTEHTPVGEPRPRLEVPEQNGGELTAELSPSAATEAPLPEQRGGPAEVESHPAT